MIARLIASFPAFLLAAPAVLAPEDTAPDLAALGDVSLLRLDGSEVSLAELLDESVLVLTYTGVGCPVSGKYAPRLARLSDELAERGVRFLGINANPQDSRAAIAKEREELGLSFPVFKDFRQELTRRLEARTTTEVFVFDGEGQLRYRGAVDDQYSLGASKPKPTKKYLVQAVEAVLAGREPEETATDAPGCLLTLLPHEELPEAVTWSHDIAPIVRKNCEVCHRPGQVGPFSLQTFDQAQGWGEMIASVVEERRMPPWNADEKYKGVFANERRLSVKQKAKILRWVKDGMPRGNPDEEPAPAKWPEGWTIGEPDVVISMERFYFGDAKPIPDEGFAVPREGTVEYQYFAAETDFGEDMWIQAMEVRPGAADVVHHVLIMLDDPNATSGLNFTSYLAVAVPGDTPSIYPEGYAKRLPAGATLVFQLHYTPNGKERFDRSSFALIFADEPPLFEVVTAAVVNQQFRIPPGASNFEVRSEVSITEDTGVISFFPHMHTRGKDFKYVAHYSDGTDEELLFSHYDFNWQESYIYHDPKLLPPGTTLECVGHFDNSDANPNNPGPDEYVEWGDQTWEEMFIGYYDHVRPLE